MKMHSLIGHSIARTLQPPEANCQVFSGGGVGRCEPNMALACVFDIQRLTNLDFNFSSVIHEYKKCGVIQLIVELSFRIKVWMLSGRSGEVSSWELIVVS